MPTVTGVSGTLSHGQTLTITGTGFGTKPHDPKPLAWGPIETPSSINPDGTLGRRSTWINHDMAVTSVSGDQPHSRSTQCLVGVWDSTQNKRSFSVEVRKSPTQGGAYFDVIFCSWLRNYETFASNNQKYWRLWPEDWPPFHDFFAAYGPSGNIAQNTGESFVSFPVGGLTNQAGDPTADLWYREEFIWAHSGGDGLDLEGNSSASYGTGIWDYRRFALNIAQKHVHHRENVKQGDTDHRDLLTDNFTDGDNLPPDGSRVLMDEIYIDDSAAHVILANNSDWKASTKSAVQIPQTWSDTEITINVNLSWFNDSGDSVWLFVSDANYRGNATTVDWTHPNPSRNGSGSAPSAGFALETGQSYGTGEQTKLMMTDSALIGTLDRSSNTDSFLATATGQQEDRSQSTDTMVARRGPWGAFP